MHHCSPVSSSLMSNHVQPNSKILDPIVVLPMFTACIHLSSKSMAFRPCSHKYFGYVCLATFKMTYQSALVFMFAHDLSALLTEPESTHPDNIYLHRRRQGSLCVYIMVIYIYNTMTGYIEYRIDNFGLKKHLPESVEKDDT